MGGDLLFIDNYADTGIGAFGVALFAALIRMNPRSRLEFTETGLGPGVAQLDRMIHHDGSLVVNVGLTSWGSSKLLNLFAFLSIGIRSRMGRPTLVLLHNLVEVTQEGDTGYRMGITTRVGAWLAVRAASRARFLVFSRSIQQVLKERYGIQNVSFTPLPCPPIFPFDRAGRLGARPVVVSFGYLSPYKGLESLIDAARLLGDLADIRVVGRPHPVLIRRKDYAQQVEKMLRTMRDSGIEYTPFIPDSSLGSELARCSVGVLSYSSTTGASASFTNLASSGVPVVATDLREFRELAADGAGILLTRGDPHSIADAVRSVLRSPGVAADMSEKQVRYASSHQMDPAAREVLALALVPASGDGGEGPE